MSFTVTINFTSATKTYTVLESGFNYTERVGAKGKHATQSILVQIRSSEAVGLFLTETKRFLPVVLKNGSTPIFEGVSRPYQKVSAYGKTEDNFSFEIMDLTEMMGDDIALSEAVSYSSQTVSTIIGNLLNLAGITGKTLDIPAALGSKVIPLVEIQAGKTVSDILSTFLFELGYDFRFSVGTIHIIPTTISSTPSQNITRITNKLNVSRADDWADGIVVNYNRYVPVNKSKRFTLYAPSTIRFDKRFGILMPFVPEPLEGIMYDGVMHCSGALELRDDNVINDGTEKTDTPPTGCGKIYFDFSNIIREEGGKSISVKNITNPQISGSMVDEKGITCNYHVRNLDVANKSIEWWVDFDGMFQNIRSTGWGWNVYISALVEYTVADQTGYEVDEASTGNKNTTYSLQYLTVPADAQAFAQREYERQKKANATYSFESTVKYNVGEFYNVADSDVTGLSTIVRILSVKTNFLSGIYEYTAEGANAIGLIVSVNQLAAKDISSAITAGLITDASANRISMGDTVTVTASGLLTQINDASITYKWFLNGVEISGETGLNVNLNYTDLVDGNNTVTIKAYISGTTEPVRESSFVVKKEYASTYTPPVFLGALDSAPTNPNTGDYYVLKSTGAMYKYNGSTWELLTSSTATTEQLISCLNGLKSAGVDLSTISNADSVTWFTTLVAQKVVGDKVQGVDAFFENINITGQASFNGNIVCPQITTVPAASGDNVGVTVSPDTSTDKWNIKSLYDDISLTANTVLDISGTFQGNITVPKILRLTDPSATVFAQKTQTVYPAGEEQFSIKADYVNASATVTTDSSGPVTVSVDGVYKGAATSSNPISFTLETGDEIVSVFKRTTGSAATLTISAATATSKGLNSRGIYFKSATDNTWTDKGTDQLYSVATDSLELSGSGYSFSSTNATRYRIATNFINYNLLTVTGISYQLKNELNAVTYNGVQKTPNYIIKNSNTQVTLIFTDGFPLVLNTSAYLSISGTIKLDGTYAGVKMQGLYPSTDNMYDVGASTNYWKNGWFRNVYADINVFDSSDPATETPVVTNVKCGASVTDTWLYGTSWYRIWSDGWIEQGGSISVSSAGQVITLHKAFADTNYTVTASGGTNVFGNTACYDKTTTNFKAWTSDDSSFNAGILQWFACGY